MPRVWVIVLPLVVIFSIWQLTERYEFEDLLQGRLTPRPSASAPAGLAELGAVMASHPRGLVRIASFDLQPLNVAKMQRPLAERLLTETVRRFDLVAIQGVREGGSELLPQLIQGVNAQGAAYDYILGPAVGPRGDKQQFGFIFNTATIQADRESAYVVADPDNLFRYDPLSVAFAARTAEPRETFTFTLVNVRIWPERSRTELPALGPLYHAVRADGRQEDDIIILGDFNADEHRLQELARSLI